MILLKYSILLQTCSHCDFSRFTKNSNLSLLLIVACTSLEVSTRGHDSSNKPNYTNPSLKIEFGY